jgi:hypothetical protein
VAGQAGLCATSFQVVTGLAAGTHTIGMAVDVGTVSNTAINIVGVKALAWIAVTSATNSL